MITSYLPNGFQFQHGEETLYVNFEGYVLAPWDFSSYEVISQVPPKGEDESPEAFAERAMEQYLKLSILQ